MQAAPGERTHKTDEGVAALQYVVDTHVLLATMQPGAARSEQHCWNAGGRQDGGIAPEAHADARRLTPGRDRRIDKHSRQWLRRIDLVRRAAKHRMGIPLEFVILAPQPIQDRVHFLKPDALPLAGKRAPLDFEHAPFGITAPLATADHA